MTVANEPTTKHWQTEVSELLVRAAQLCVDHQVDLEAFVRGAYSSYLDARPGMREWLEEQQLRAQLAELRESGRLPSA
jgi:hypothetical protein